MSTANGCGHGGKGDGTGVPLGWRQGHGGSKPPLSPNPQEGMMKWRMKTERWGK
jgi:hypothetical protein